MSQFQNSFYFAKASAGGLGYKLLVWLPFVISLSATVIYIWKDFYRHREPLIEEKPNIHYTFSHHLKVVVIPKVRYVLRERVMPQKLPEH